MKEVPSSEVSEARKVEPKKSAYIDNPALGEEKKLDQLRNALVERQQQENGIPTVKEKSPLTEQRSSEGRLQERTEAPLPGDGFRGDAMHMAPRKPDIQHSEERTETSLPGDGFRGDVMHKAFKKHDIQRFDEQLPDGRDVTVVGNPEGFRKYNHQQGNYGYSGTCGIVSCEDVLHQFGKKASEPKLIAYADQNGLFIDAIGGIDTFGCTKIISDYGVPAKPQFYGNIAQLAQYMEEGRGVIISVNAGDLWQSTDKRDHAEPGRTNHAVVVTGVAYERGTTKIVGFYINDSGTNKSGQFISADIMQLAWQDRKGQTTVTNGSYNQ